MTVFIVKHKYIILKIYTYILHTFVHVYLYASVTIHIYAPLHYPAYMYKPVFPAPDSPVMIMHWSSL